MNTKKLSHKKPNKYQKTVETVYYPVRFSKFASAMRQRNTNNHPLPWSQRFFLIFSRLEMIEPRSGDRYLQVAKRQERKTSGYLGLESHFHADARVRI